MAGYFKKNNGYVYDGEDYMICNVDAGVKNGQFVELGAGGLVLAAAKIAGYTFRVVELTTLEGSPAVRADVVTIGDGEVYMCEAAAIDTVDDAGEIIVKKGALMRKRRPQTGDQIIVNVTASGLAVGDTLAIESGTGMLIKSA